MNRILLSFLFLSACASTPLNPQRLIVTEIKIHELGGVFSLTRSESANFEAIAPLKLDQKQHVASMESESREVASDDIYISSNKPSEYAIMPQAGEGGYIRFFLFKNERPMGAVSLKEQPGESGSYTEGPSSISLKIIEINDPD